MDMYARTFTFLSEDVTEELLKPEFDKLLETFPKLKDKAKLEPCAHVDGALCLSITGEFETNEFDEIVKYIHEHFDKYLDPEFKSR